MNKTLRNILVLVIVFAAAFFFARMNRSNDETFKREQIILGTVVEIQIRNTDQEIADKAATEAFNEIRRIDDLFTTYDESPVVKINNTVEPVIKEVNSEIFSLLLMCDSISGLTGNAFDVSLHELITLWGFESGIPSIPAKDQINKALYSSGWEKVNLSNNSVTRLNNVKFNFGAIAKGYAVDRAINILKQNGINEALVNAGGEVKTIGTNWKTGIKHPRKNDIIARIRTDNISVATSGDYEQSFEEDGKRYHHILDPSTGFPAAKCQSVTIITGNNFTADALATGVFVMGQEKGITLIESLPSTEAMIIDSSGKVFVTSGFNNYLVKEN